MWKDSKKFLLTPQRTKSAPLTPITPPPSTEKEQNSITRADSFHISHKVPTGDSPYVKAKHVQLIDRDPSKAISLFWSAINSGDRVDSALKDMAVIMKQLDRTDEAIEAIKSFRSLCSNQAQESLDNVLIDLYKRAGRIDEHIELLQRKLKLVEDGVAFGGKRTKVSRSQGKKFHCSIDQEKSRLLGNLGWAYMQQENYQVAEELYRKALSIEPDKNKQCNLAICLMHKGRLKEAKSLLHNVKPSSTERELADSYIKSFDRATEMLTQLESVSVLELNEQKKNDNLKTEIQRSFASPINVKSSSQVSSKHGDDQNNRCDVKWADNLKSQASSIHVDHQTHEFDVRWIENSNSHMSFINGNNKEHRFRVGSSEDSNSRVSSINEVHQNHEFGVRRIYNSNSQVSSINGDNQQHGFGRKWVEEDPNEEEEPIFLDECSVNGFEKWKQEEETYGGNRILSQNRFKNGSDFSHFSPVSSKGYLSQNTTAKGSEFAFFKKEIVCETGNKEDSARKNIVTADGGMGFGSLVSSKLESTDKKQQLMFGSKSETDRRNNSTSREDDLSETDSTFENWNHFYLSNGDRERISELAVSSGTSETTDRKDTTTSQEGMNDSDSIFGNWKPFPFSIHNKCEKSWADMVEEEEEERRQQTALSGFTEFSANIEDYPSQDENLNYLSRESYQTPTKLLADNWIERRDAFDNENLDSNITLHQLSSKNQMNNNLQMKFEEVDIKEGYFRKPTARRSLYFDQTQKQDHHQPADYFYPTPNSTTATTTNGSKNSKPARKVNRLQVFKEITLPDSPRG